MYGFTVVRVAGIKKAGPEGGMHRFLGFRRPLRGRTHRFLAAWSTVTCVGYMVVAGYRATGRGRSRVGGVRNGITCVWTGYRSMLAGRPGLNSDQAASHAVPDSPAEPTDSTPDVVTCDVTVISWLGRERHAPFLIRNPKKSTHGFLMPRFLNARR